MHVCIFENKLPPQSRQCLLLKGGGGGGKDMIILRG